MAKRKSKAPGKLKTVVSEVASDEGQLGLFDGESHSTGPVLEGETDSTAPAEVTVVGGEDKFCSSCGKIAEGADKFCSSCGHNLQGDTINILFEPSSYTASYPGGVTDPEEVWRLIAPRINVTRVNFDSSDDGPTFHISCGLGTPPADPGESNE